MAKARTAILGQSRATSRTVPLNTGNHGVGMYIMSYPAHLMAVIHVVMMYQKVVNHGTMLKITNL
jgi:hypothetical protein